MIYHADMYLMPGAIDSIEKHLTDKTIVSLTRIEPPLHPDGPEKVLMDFGVEPEEFKEDDLLDWFTKPVDSTGGYQPKHGETTEGIFAPWAFYKKDFQEIGGHDPLYAPQSKEDSDIFNRFQLNGIKFIQTWHGCVYHMTCRGSRRNTIDKAKNIYEDSPEWLAQNQRSARNFVRKWGHVVRHDEYLKPQIPPKYNVAFKVKNCSYKLLELLEPWCDVFYGDGEWFIYNSYIQNEQPNTAFNLNNRIKPLDSTLHDYSEGIVVEIDGNNFKQGDYTAIEFLSEVIRDGGEIGEFELENLNIIINDLTTYEQNLIICK
jgi:hypothetical protein